MQTNPDNSQQTNADNSQQNSISLREYYSYNYDIAVAECMIIYVPDAAWPVRDNPSYESEIIRRRSILLFNPRVIIKAS